MVWTCRFALPEKGDILRTRPSTNPMSYFGDQLIPAQHACHLAPPTVLLLLPITIAVWYRYKALRNFGEERSAIWYRYRSLSRFIILTTIAAWWALWDLNRWAGALNRLPSWLSRLALGNDQHLLFSVPVLASLFLFQFLNYSGDKTIGDLHWSQMAIWRRAWWSVVQNVVSMLMVAVAFEAFFAGRYFGILWMLGAAATHRVGMVFLRLAEGMRFHPLKSGELRNRSLAMARKMGISLRRVCIVPAGKGHLTNAFGGSRMIALTDALPKYLNKQQMDSAIAHELIHVKHKHARLGSLLVCAFFSALILLMFNLHSPMMQFRPLLDIAVVYVPMLGFYYFSRHAELEADREAVLYTGDPETAIRALANMYRSGNVPVCGSKLSELFQAHPSLTRRALAIARAAGLPEDRVSKIMKEAGLSGGLL